MSGSGGFYKYRCKYFYTHDCPNWVFVNHAPCADCCAAGRDVVDDEDAAGASSWRRPTPAGSDIEEISFPIFQDGVLQYALMDVVVSAEPGHNFTSWTFRQKSHQQAYQQVQAQQQQAHASMQLPPHTTSVGGSAIRMQAQMQTQIQVHLQGAPAGAAATSGSASHHQLQLHNHPGGFLY